jgi:cytochrome c2
MPDFKLSREEAASLSAFLIARSTRRDDGIGGGPGDAASGARLVAALGCQVCHDARARSASDAPPLERLERADWSASGCAARGGSTGRAPDLDLEAGDRQALWALRAAGLEALGRECLAEAGEELIHALRCTACHERDGEPSTWSLVAAETDPFASPEAPAVAVQSRPSLTFTGEQLEEAWLRDLLSGRLPYTTRPWLEARMPVFRAGAAAIARGLILEHGSRPGNVPAGATPPRDAPAGGRLIGAAGGFSCVTCHPVGTEPALMTHHFGAINLVHARARLRPEFYIRWMRNPQRIAPLTAMPAYADDSGTATPLAEVLGGDAARQFEAIWDYLGTLR